MHRLTSLVCIIALLALSVIPALAQSTDVPDPSGTLGLGDTIEGELTEEAPALLYTLEAEAGQLVTIRLSSDDFDSYLTLYDADGAIIAENDDSDGRNSAIQTFTLPQSASYVLLVESYDQHWGGTGAAGSFTLSAVEQEVETIEYTQTVEGEFADAVTSMDYRFSGQAGDIVEISLSSEDFDSRLTLLDAEGSELTSNDDSMGSRNSLIAPYPLPETGSYIIRASSFGGGETGSYTLTVNKTELVAISDDESVEVDLEARTGMNYFSFEGETGDLITLAVAGADIGSTNLILRDPSGYDLYPEYGDVLSEDAEFSESQYQQVLSESGMFIVVLHAEAEDAEEAVTITLTRTPPSSLDESAQTLEFTTSTRAAVFAGSAGETVTLRLQALDDATASPSITVMQQGQTLSYISASSVTNLSATFGVPSDEEVLVMIEEYSYSGDTISIEVSLERATADE